MAPSAPRLWWIAAAGLLLMMLLLPWRLAAQGLRSNAATVTLIAIKRDTSEREVGEMELAPTWTGPASSVAVRLIDPAPQPAYVRSRTGRLERLVTDRFIEVAPATLRFRGVRPFGTSATWHVEVRAIDAGTGVPRVTDAVLHSR